MLHNRLFQAITVAAFMCLSAVAQIKPAASNCPKERTQLVAADLSFGPPQNCPGVSFNFGGLQVLFPANTCPMHMIYVPLHETAVPSATDTYVRHIATDPITMVTFRCERSYFFIIPLGSTCVTDRTLTVGSVMRLITSPCKQPEA
ncbi:MAG: hypothetical protein MUC36_03530 [Planctomycetes bacterium]|nr:hypothetical protein [Planctomycetota bacterium]